MPFIDALAVVHQPGALAALEALIKVQLGTPMTTIIADKARARAP